MIGTVLIILSVLLFLIIELFINSKVISRMALLFSITAVGIATYNTWVNIPERLAPIQTSIDELQRTQYACNRYIFRS